MIRLRCVPFVLLSVLSLLAAGCSTSAKKIAAGPEIKSATADVTADVEEAEPVATKPVEPVTPPIAATVSAPLQPGIIETQKHPERAVPLPGTEAQIIPEAGGAKNPPPPTTKKGPNYFVITAAEKTPAHPLFGKGSRLGLVLDNIPGKSVVLKRGEVYEFDVQTNPLHDVYFSMSPMGWGGGTVTEGIKGQFTYRGTITVSPTGASPEIMYYQCRNHSSMGGKVVVVNKSASAADIARLLAVGESVQGSEGSRIEQKDVPVDAAKQKIMLVEMMLQSKAAKAVAETGTDVAKASLANANEKLRSAQQELGAGRSGSALTLAEAALKLVSSANQTASHDERSKLQRGRYDEMLETLKNFQDSHKQSFERIVKKRGTSAAVDYDHAKVNGLVAQARDLAGKNQFDKAAQNVSAAERIVTQAIQAMLDSQTIVYDLNFESPAEEYDYEIKRFVGYEELVPIAIDEKKPTEAILKLMNTYLEKGRAQKIDAIQKAKSGNYPDAISLMVAATEEIRRALRLAGVSQ